jgi:4-amino-4-deoxy-L-arabinose transferase
MNAPAGARSLLLPLALLLLYVVLYLVPLGQRPLIIPDETRYAEIPREMIVSGDWITPRLDGLRYFEKPPLGYWLNALSMSAFGENAFAVRLPGTLATGLTALTVYLLVLSAWRDRRLAAAAALVHLTLLEVFVVGTFNVLDNLVTLFLTAGIALFYRALDAQWQGGRGGLLALLAGAAFGLAFLAKGFLAFAVPVLVLVPWALWQGQWRTLLIDGFLAVLAAALVALPWSVLIHLRQHDFWHYFFWIEHIKRFTAENAQHRAPPYYFLMYLPALAFPWIFLLPAALAGLRGRARATVVANIRQRDALRLAWLWLLLPFAFFSASSGKLATYILPCFPPLAVLLTVGLAGCLRAGRCRLYDLGLGFNGLVLAGIALALVVLRVTASGVPTFDADETGEFLLLTGALAAGALAGLAGVRATRLPVRLGASLALVLLPLLAVPWVYPREAERHKSPGQALLAYRDRLTPDSIVITDDNLVRAVAWYLKRTDIYLVSTGELGYGLGYPDARYRLLDPARLRALLAHNAGRQAVLMACLGPCPAALTAQLPAAAQQDAEGMFHFRYVPAGAPPAAGPPR